jgi:hypothetical protein
MKRLFLTACLFAPVGLPAASPVGLLPEDKVPVVLTDEERNPFGKQATNVTTAAVVAVDNEELRIRSALESLPVSGITEGRTGRKVLLGGVTLEEGSILPPVVANQSEKLRVVQITQDKAELAFLEADGNPGMRRIIIDLNLTPTVQFRVVRPAGPAAQGASTFDGVLTKDEIGASR